METDPSLPKRRSRRIRRGNWRSRARISPLGEPTHPAATGAFRGTTLDPGVRRDDAAYVSAIRL